MLILALESSTSSAKAMLFNPETGETEVRSSFYSEHGCLKSEGVTDTRGVFELTAKLGRELAEGKDVAAVALCGTFHSMAVLDGGLSDGVTYSWNYTEPSAMCVKTREDESLAGKLYESTGCMPNVTYMRETMRYLGEKGLRLSDKTLLSQGAYNFYRLTGGRRESVGTASGSGLLNIHSLDYDDFALEYAGIKREQLGELARYTDALPLNDEGARLLGVKSGIPVVPAHPDGALNQIANGAAVVGRMTLSVGTSGAIRLTSSRPVIPDGRELWCYYGVTDWLSGAAIAGACNCIDWFKDKLLGGRFSFDELEGNRNEGEAAPVFLPFLFGERCPGWRDDRRGGFEGITPRHGFSDMYAAVREGVLFNLYQSYEALCRIEKAPEKIIVSGGILHSRQWTQMVADVFKHEIVLVKNINASTVGAAVLGAWAAGAIENVAEYTAETDGAETVAPNPESSDYYARQYERYLNQYSI